MQQYFQKFSKLMGVKSHPNDYELSLFQKTQKYCRYINWIPGLKMVAVCNSLSMYATKDEKNCHSCESRNLGMDPRVKPEDDRHNEPEDDKTEKGQQNIVIASETKQSILDHHEVLQTSRDDRLGSDIDLFIITAPNRIWLVRFLVTGIFQILGVRRYGNKVKDRFCLSFFITENAMDFSQIAIENDIYLYYWIYFLKPIINKDSTYEKFIKANKSLGIDEINLHPDNKVYITKPIYVISSVVEKSINLILSPLLDLKNWVLKKIFLPFTLAHKKRLGDPYGIIVSDDILKFTDNDRRVEIRDKIIRN